MKHFLLKQEQATLSDPILKGRSGNKFHKYFESTEAQLLLGFKSSASRIEGTRSSEAFLLLRP
jgi:hypothetical protein